MSTGQPTDSPATEPPPAATPTPSHRRAQNMLPARERRSLGLERGAVRLIATCGVVAIGVAIGAIMVSSGSQGWLVGLVVAGVSVALSAVLWSSQRV